MVTNSAEETNKAGKAFANRLKGGEILALVGGLGSGKTTFVQGLAEGLGVSARVISPTFILQRHYPVERDGLPINSLYHLDLYRLDGNVNTEFLKVGIEDYWNKSNCVVVIEWADKVKELIPKSAIWISFNIEGDSRMITIK